MRLKDWGEVDAAERYARGAGGTCGARWETCTHHTLTCIGKLLLQGRGKLCAAEPFFCASDLYGTAALAKYMHARKTSMARLLLG